MTFANKFDLLMRLSNTSNNTIAKYLAMDPSYISRLRRGERNRPRHQDYIVSICAFFARQFLNGGSLQNFADSVADASVASIRDSKELSSYLEAWLLSDSDGAAPPQDAPRPSGNAASPIVPYYGIAGRYRAMVALLSYAMNTLPSFTLLMYSDEGNESPEEQCVQHAKWNALLRETIHRGNRVKIILKTSRNMDEMFHSVSYWLPLYASGVVDAYYYPRLRDGVYKRVLYVIPGCAAVFSTAIGAFGENTSTFFVSDCTTVDSLNDEFYSYLSLCNPLMEKISLKSRPLAAPSSSCIVSFHQNWLSETDIFPTALLISLQNTPGLSSLTLLLHEQDISAIEKALEEQDHSHPFSEACLRFLEAILSLSRSISAFTVILANSPIGEHTCAVYENGYTLVLKNGQPSEALMICEEHISSTVWEILTLCLESASYKSVHASLSMEHVQSLLTQVRRLYDPHLYG